MSRLRSAYAGSLNRWTDSSSWCACGSHPACGEVEDAAAANGWELVAVAEERDPRVRSVGDGEQRAGGVLVEHAGLVDEEDVAGEQAGTCIRTALGCVGSVDS